jgi:V/A-type H+-transporting ATPase subunit D
MENTSPTRTSLVELAARRRAAEKGLDLLRGKREALVRELLAAMDRAIASRDRLHEAMKGAASALAVAQGLSGTTEVSSAAAAARREMPVEVSARNVWGVRFPEIRHPRVVRSCEARGYGLSGVSCHTNAAAREFEKALEATLGIASVEARLKRIGDEVRKGTRMINALNEVVLPGLRRRMRAIRLVLEEREGEDAFRLRRFKKSRAAQTG